MTNEEKKVLRRQNNRIFLLLSGFRAMRISNWLLCLALFILQAFFIFNKYYNASAIYICVAILILPGVLRWLVKNKNQHIDDADSELPFPLLRKRYGFTSLKYKSYMATFVLALTFLGYWYRTSKNGAAFEAAPNIILLLIIGFVALRLIIGIGNYLYLRIYPLKAMKN